MYYMYAYYVFRWPRGITQVSIDKHMSLFDDVSIEGEWTPESLIRFAQPWARAQLGA